jgi:hypothetical protein
MKTVLFSFLLSVLLLLGCNETPIQPDVLEEPVETEIETYEIIQIPPRAGGGPSITKTETIDGSKGGHVKFKENYITVDGDTVVVDVHLHAHKNSFSGIVDITVTVDDVYAAVKLTPPMIFNTHVDLDLKYKGLDPAQLNLPSGEYEFLYVDDEGNTETVPSHGVKINAEIGEISVKHAKLSHFSRYAFAR